MSLKKLSRRKFLTLSAFAAAGAAVTACSPSTPAAQPTQPPAAVDPTDPPAVDPTEVEAQPTATVAELPEAPPTEVPMATYNEAPMLAEMVAAGTLPPVEERLPLNPKVITPFDSIGTYGETLHRGTVNISGYLVTNQAHEALFEYPYPFLSSGPVEPNLAESWDFNDDGTELVVNLRQGLKWSDGAPFTADDILFIWDDIWFTEEALTPPPSALFVDGEAPTLEKIDDFTLRFTFVRPFYYALHNFAALAEWALPKHFVSEFHPTYNTDATWEDFVTKFAWWEGRGAVVVQPWMLESYNADSHITLVRNPYYFKVDTEGNQLPYIDYYQWNVIPDRPNIALKAVAGEIDLDGMWVGVPQIPLFFAEQEARGFSLGWYEDVIAFALFPNYDYERESTRNVLRDVNFRRALSLAMNRTEINRTFYFDLLEISGSCFNGVTPFWDEACKDIYTAYDPEAAMALLDEAGIVDVNGDGYRETPEGDTLELIVDVYQHDLYVPLMEMVTEQFEEVGLRTILNVQLQDATLQRRLTNEFMFSTGDFDGADRPLEYLAAFAPVTENTPFWHKNAKEDPVSPEYVEFTEILIDATSTPREEMITNMKRASTMLAENVWVLSVGNMRRPYFIGKGVFNVPETASRTPADTPPMRPYQIYIDRSAS